MAAPKGNDFWKFRTKIGRDKLFETPEVLWEEACKYFQWCKDNPLMESKAFAYMGEVKVAELPKMRVMTLSGLCLYLKCTESYFRVIKSRDGTNKEAFVTVIEEIEKTIFDQQFSGAAADLLNANIIARSLGLVDKKDVTTDGDTINTNPVFKIFTTEHGLASSEDEVEGQKKEP